MKKAIAIFTLWSFTFATIGPYPVTPSEAALAIGSREESLPEFGRTSRIFNLERRNQLEKAVAPSVLIPQEEIPTVEPSLGMEPKVVNISSLSYSPSPMVSVTSTTVMPTPPTSVAVAQSASASTAAGEEGGDEGGLEIGPGGKWSVTRTFVTKGEFTLQYLIKLIKWALEFVEELNRERRDRRSHSQISSEE